MLVQKPARSAAASVAGLVRQLVVELVQSQRRSGLVQTPCGAARSWALSGHDAPNVRREFQIDHPDVFRRLWLVQSCATRVEQKRLP